MLSTCVEQVSTLNVIHMSGTSFSTKQIKKKNLLKVDNVGSGHQIFWAGGLYQKHLTPDRIGIWSVGFHRGRKTGGPGEKPIE